MVTDGTNLMTTNNWQRSSSSFFFFQSFIVFLRFNGKTTRTSNKVSASRKIDDMLFEILLLYSRLNPSASVLAISSRYVSNSAHDKYRDQTDHSAWGNSFTSAIEFLWMAWRKLLNLWITKLAGKWTTPSSNFAGFECPTSTSYWRSSRCN